MDQTDPLTIAFAIHRVHRHGGLQRDLLRIAARCRDRGHAVRIYTGDWEGDTPADFDVRIVNPSGLSNHARARSFADLVHADLKRDPAAVLAGFNKMPGLDVYFCGDNCFAARTQQKPWWHRLTPRTRIYLDLERAVFGPDANTLILLVAEPQKIEYQQHYETPDERIIVLPAGAAERFFEPVESDVRRELNIADDQFMILQVGSSFDTKGVDRAIRAVANKNATYVVVGDGDAQPLKQLADQLGARVIFTGPRQDVERYMAAADLMLHPARNEASGTTLVEALATGLPVLCSGVCGYASIVRDCEAGRVLSEPFDQGELDRTLAAMLDRDVLRAYREAAKRNGTRDKLSGLDRAAADAIISRARAL